MFDSCLCVDPDEVVTLLSRNRRTARKPHKCGECGCTIQPGETYEADSTVFDRKFTVYKTCLPCLRIRQSLFRCGWYYGGLWEDIHEAFCGEDDDGNMECVCPSRR